MNSQAVIQQSKNGIYVALWCCACMLASAACSRAAESSTGGESSTSREKVEKIKNTEEIVQKPTPSAKPKQRGQSKERAIADTDTHVLRVDRPVEVSSNADNSFKITLTPKKGWKINQEFPTKLRIEAASGVQIAKPIQKAKDAAKFGEKGATFVVPFTSNIGDKKFKASLKFAMCTEATCDPKKENLAWSIKVK